MKERYEKQGVTARLESSQRGTSFVRLCEAGWSEIVDESFSCGPMSIDKKIADPDVPPLHHIEEKIRRIARGRATIERLTIVSGSATHSAARDSAPTRRWADSSARVFATVVSAEKKFRTSISLGAAGVDKIDLAPLHAVCQALALPPADLSSSPQIALNPLVSAGLIRALADFRTPLPGALRLVQAPPPGVFDAFGRHPRRRIVRPARDQWPESFRPSYRFEPLREPLHVDLAGARVPEVSSDPVVVANSSTWRQASARRFSSTALVTDPNRGVTSTCEIAVDTSEWTPARVQAGSERLWFPEGAGAWGRVLTLREPAAVVRSL